MSRIPNEEKLFGLKMIDGRNDWFEIKNKTDFHVSLASQIRTRGQDDYVFIVEKKGLSGMSSIQGMCSRMLLTFHILGTQDTPT